jgi:hypothetical protein
MGENDFIKGRLVFSLQASVFKFDVRLIKAFVCKRTNKYWFAGYLLLMEAD